MLQERKKGRKRSQEKIERGKVKKEGKKIEEKSQIRKGMPVGKNELFHTR